jgi:site-specific DNA-methyltransferase (cytosine-N4-specific)
MSITLLHGDTIEQMRELPEQSAQTCVTSPPYWRLRRYTDDPREIGQEETIADYVEALARVFDEVWRVLRDDGTLWLNIGDAYANDTKWGGASGGKNYTSAGGAYGGQRVKGSTGLPPKSLIGLPWRVAFALQDRGWVLRAEIIWHKPNVMPESVTDRPTRDHEQVFLFAKQDRYYYDGDAIRVPYSNASIGRYQYRLDGTAPTSRQPGGDLARRKRETGTRDPNPLGRARRTVWTIPNSGLPDEHYAAFPESLVGPCILAGSRPGDTVLDPFVGSGTTCRVAETLGRNSIGIDLGYQELQERRTNNLQISMEALL